MIKLYDKEKDVWKRKFNIKEIGHQFSSDICINIKKEFADKHLFEDINPFHPYFDNSHTFPVNGTDTNIICPFCEKGTIIMVKKKKDICETHVCHTGDSYTFYCSNFSELGCQGVFFYHTIRLYC